MSKASKLPDDIQQELDRHEEALTTLAHKHPECVQLLSVIRFGTAVGMCDVAGIPAEDLLSTIRSGAS